MGRLPDTKLSDYCQFLPDKPYSTDVLGQRLVIRKRENAVKHAHIQPNRITSRIWLPLDGDERGAWFLPGERDLPPPTYTAINRENGHAHFGYLLETPVSMFSDSREGPIRLFRDVERLMRNRLGADRSYSGFLTKNPVHSKWEVDWTNCRHRLNELVDCFDRSEKKRLPEVELDTGTGRNKTLFDTLRKIGYREVLRFKKAGAGIESFRLFLRKHADALNDTFPVKLWSPEVGGIVKSVAKWIWGKFSVEKFSAAQSARGRLAWRHTDTLSRSKPWEAEGVSRRTWYRRRPQGITYPDMVFVPTALTPPKSPSSPQPIPFPCPSAD